ncbi:MAG: DUF5455 family protein [Methylobacter sp.]|nr:DUF5455 family protein [Methylobacter sp.]
MGVLFGVLMNFLVDQFGKLFLHSAFKIAITLLFISLVVAAIVAYVSTFGTIVNGIAQSVPEIVHGVWGWVMPPNTNICLFALFSCVMLRFVTRQYLLLMNNRFRAAISN